MVTCPACGTSMEADFGMTTCPACQSVFMVDIDGTVAAPEDSSGDEGQDVGVEAAAVDEGEGVPADEEILANDFAANDSFASEAQDQPYEEPTVIEETLVAEGDSESEDAPAEYSEDFLDTLDGDAAPQEDDPNDPLGVTAFDSNEASQLVDGPYYYDVMISGIDTAQLKQQVMDVLSDKRLSWSGDEIKKKIKMGQLHLANLNPVRAVLVVLKLQALDVDVEWSQRPYTAEPGSAKDRET